MSTPPATSATSPPKWIAAAGGAKAAAAINGDLLSLFDYLVEFTGIGPIGAATILGSVGDIARFPTAGHFASYNATAPIEASSGNKTRHRLNPRGNRKLNQVLHIAAVSQVHYSGQGRVYYDKQIAEGETCKEAVSGR